MTPIPPPGPPVRAVRAALTELATDLANDLAVQLRMPTDAESKASGWEVQSYCEPRSLSLDLFADDFADDGGDVAREEARALADEEADPFDGEDESPDVFLPSAPRLPPLPRPAEPAFSTAPPLSVLRSIGQLADKYTAQIPPPPPLPDGTPFLRKPVTMTTESLKQIAALQNDEGISFVLDVDLDEFYIIRKIIGTSADAESPESGDAPAESWRIDTLTVRAHTSGARGNLASNVANLSAAESPSDALSPWAGLRDWRASLAVAFDVSVQTVLWAEVQKSDGEQYSVSLRFQTKDGTTAKFALAYADSDYPVWGAVADALKARNERLIKKGFKIPDWLSAALLTSSLPIKRKLPPRDKLLPDELLYASSTVNKGIVNALTRPDQWGERPLPDFAYGLHQEYQNLKITVGLPDGTQSESLWTYLAEGGARMVKAHYALWGRWYEGGGEKTKYVVININQFCADMGYAKAKNGGFKLRDKQNASRILEALTSIELRATFTKPGSKKGTVIPTRLRGGLWQKGFINDEGKEIPAHEYKDLFGSAGLGDANFWEPSAFSYEPGPWFFVQEWAAYNQFVGKIGAGLMRLHNTQDEWAILIGGYLGTIIRADGYKQQDLIVGNLLRSANLAQSDDAARRIKDIETKLARNLDRLAEVGVIKSWDWHGVDVSEVDMNDPQALAEYGAADPMPKGNFYRRKVLIDLPNEADRDRLGNAREEAIEASKKKTARKESIALREAARKQSESEAE